MNKFAYIFLLIIPISLYGQDVHFVQSSTIPQLINPATAGVFDGWERVSISHRQQWLSVGSPYVTSQLSADLNLFKKENGTSKGYLGIGLNFYNDVAGDAKFGTNKFSLAVNGIIQVAEDQTASVAIEVGGAQRSGDVNKLDWGNQFNGQDGFDSQIASNEANISSFIYPDFGAGVFYRFNGHKSTFLREEIQNFYAGASYFHFSQPVLKYGNGAADSLYSKMVFHGGMLMDIPGSKVTLAPSFAYFQQNKFKEILSTLLVKFRIHEGTRYTGIYSESYFSIGATYRTSDAIVPQIQLERGNYKLGLSYELTTSKLNNAAQGGFEVSFQWANINNALFKGRRFKGWKKPGAM